MPTRGSGSSSAPSSSATTRPSLSRRGGWRIFGTPTEGGALVVAAEKAGLSRDDAPEPVKEFSFNSTRKRMTTVYREGEGNVAHVKGAPEVLLARSSRVFLGGSVVPLTDELRDALLAEIERYASQGGLRVLGGAACRPLPAGIEWTVDTVETDLVFLGLAGIVDPPHGPRRLRRSGSAGAPGSTSS